MTVRTGVGTSSRGDADRGVVLLALARDAIAQSLGLDNGAASPDKPVTAPGVDSLGVVSLGAQCPDIAGHPWLEAAGACFVTLHLRSRQAQNLRGCIGTIDPYRSLLDDVRGNATSAAFRDPRFPPLQPAEYSRLHVEVSELSPREQLGYRDRADLVAQLRPGVDGVMLAYDGRRGTYLPQVWEHLPDPDVFLASLVVKARLPADFWSDDIEAWRYTVTAYEE